MLNDQALYVLNQLRKRIDERLEDAYEAYWIEPSFSYWERGYIEAASKILDDICHLIREGDFYEN